MCRSICKHLRKQSNRNFTFDVFLPNDFQDKRHFLIESSTSQIRSIELGTQNYIDLQEDFDTALTAFEMYLYLYLYLRKRPVKVNSYKLINKDTELKHT